MELLSRFVGYIDAYRVNGCASGSSQPLVNRIMPTHINRHDLMLGQQHLKRDSVAHVDGHAVDARELALKRVQS